jgi:hypothetical protein
MDFFTKKARRPDTRCWMRDARYRMLDTGCRLPPKAEKSYFRSGLFASPFAFAMEDRSLRVVVRISYIVGAKS